MENKFSVEEIKDLTITLGRSGMNRLKIKSGDYSLEIEGTSVASVPAAASAPAPVAAPAAAPEPIAAPGDNVVTSPIVGTFYQASAPENPPFVKVGSTVKRGDVLFIIESMKLMNEVTEPVRRHC
jgi:biotin carboxyl carrier protein